MHLMENKVGIVNLNLGNVKSVYNALEYLNAKPVFVRKYSDLKKVNSIILPGVGSFDHGVKLMKNFGIFEELTNCVIKKKMPFMGICLGMQLIFEGSEEGKLNGLSWLKGRFKRFVPSSEEFTVPHIGWNKVEIQRPGKLFASLGHENYFYFVHSYFLPKESQNNLKVVSYCNYIMKFISAIEHENIWCCQFHPEKSQMSGLKLLDNFLTFSKL